jgi:hypothetical protein
MYKNKLLYPLVPLDLKKFDLFGFPVIDDLPPKVGYHPFLVYLRSIYHPDKFGNIRFIIFVLNEPPYVYSENFVSPTITTCDKRDISKGKLFCIQIPYSKVMHFYSDYAHKYKSYLIIINPTIDDIAKYPIYSPESFYQMSQTSNFSYMVPNEKLFVDCSAQIIEGSAAKYVNFAVTLKSTLHRVMNFSQRFAFSNNNYSRLVVYVIPIIECLKLNYNEWRGGMETLEKFTYSNSKEQLKIIWNSRKLELIDF